MAKRKRSPDLQGFVTEESLSDHQDPDEEYESHDPQEYKPEKGAKQRPLDHVRIHGPAHPRSAYAPCRAPESHALADLQKAWTSQATSTPEDESGYRYLKLDNFSVYRVPDRARGLEMTSLDRLQNQRGFDELRFDGVLICGNERQYVEGVPFRTLTIEGYGDQDTDLTGPVCIQSSRAKRLGIWYQLGTPAPVYKRFHETFMWLVRFTKYFVEYLMDHDKVELEHFRASFATWLFQRCDSDTNLTFQSWWAQCNLHDFRSTITVHVGFLWKETSAIDYDPPTLTQHPLWGEINPQNFDAIPRQPSLETRTIVTPFVGSCFDKTYFADQLEVRDIRLPATRQVVANRKLTMGLTRWSSQSAGRRSAFAPLITPRKAQYVRVGNVVAMPPQPTGQWKRSRTTVWYAYIHTTHRRADEDMLDVIWLYQPKDTTIRDAPYRFPNELFFSDLWTSEPASDILGVVDVVWFCQDPMATDGFFVRQTYLQVPKNDDFRFVTLERSHFNAAQSTLTDLEECVSKYRVGDTILYKVNRHDVLEPAQIIHFNHRSQRVGIRLLGRQQALDPNARPNQLILTNDRIETKASRFVRRCHVRFFYAVSIAKGCLPTPYDRDGAGDYYFIASRKPDNSAPVEHDLPPIPLGWDPTSPPSIPKMKGLSAFCGAGSFDRGLEEGGGLQFDYVLDWDPAALHAHRANNPRKDTSYFLGSANDCLAQAMAGMSSELIPAPDAVDCCCGGNPCRGFAHCNMHKQSNNSLRDASLVASLLSFVDFWNPKYFLLENVVSMAENMGANKDENVFSQVIATLVALGYQVQQLLGEPWSFGSSQHRPRLFIVASAPGLQPFSPLDHSHGHPDYKDFRAKALGKVNSKPFGCRRDDTTPFQYIPSSRIVNDLPDIGDGQAHICPAYPYHQTPKRESTHERGVMALVSILPHGMGVAQAAKAGRLSGAYLRWMKTLTSEQRNVKTSNSYSRIHPQQLFPTLMTTLYTADARTGPTLHWQYHRTLTIMECRRVQGLPDDEVLVGTPAEMMRMLGNAVDRKMALALGLAFRKVWLGNAGVEDNDAAGRDVVEVEVDAMPGTNVRSVPVNGIEDNTVRRDGMRVKGATQDGAAEEANLVDGELATELDEEDEDTIVVKMRPVPQRRLAGIVVLPSRRRAHSPSATSDPRPHANGAITSPSSSRELWYEVALR